MYLGHVERQCSDDKHCNTLFGRAPQVGVRGMSDRRRGDCLVSLPAVSLLPVPASRRAPRRVVCDPETGEIGRGCIKCHRVVHEQGSTLCAGHWQVAWSYKSPEAKQRELRRRRRRERERRRAEREAKRAEARQMDRTEGRRCRRAAHGALTLADSHAAKRAFCAGSERQSKPWEALGISRSTYLRHKLHGAPQAVTPGSADKTCFLLPTHCSSRGERGKASQAGCIPAPFILAASHGVGLRRPMRNRFGLSLLNPFVGETPNPTARGKRGKSPHRFAGGPLRSRADIQLEHMGA